MKNLTTCFDSSRSRSCYDRCELISVHISRGLKQNVSIMSSFIRPMLWLLWTNHEVWCKSYQSWVVLLLMSINVININTLFLREHMCNKFQKYVKQALTENYLLLTLQATKLTEGADYHFRVMAENKVGLSEPLYTTAALTPRSKFSQYSLS